MADGLGLVAKGIWQKQKTEVRRPKSDVRNLTSEFRNQKSRDEDTKDEKQLSIKNEELAYGEGMRPSSHSGLSERRRAILDYTTGEINPIVS